MVSVSRTISLAAFIAAAPVARGAELSLQGSYQADIWGTVALSTEGKERLVGQATQGNPCGFEPGVRVLEGTLQGRVFVGEFNVCLQGTGCPKTESLPVLGFHSPEEGSLTAFIRIQKGCSSPVLGEEGLVVLRSPEAVRLLGEANAAMRASLSSGRVTRRNPEAAKAALERGGQLLREKKWSSSVFEFERSIALGEQSWVAFFGLGTAQLMRNQVNEAIEMLSRAQKLNRREPSISYTLACAYSRLGKKEQALLLLEQAVKSGYALKAGTQDLGLEKLLLSDPSSIARYTENIQEAFRNAEAPPARRRQAQGP
ncbi:tetratricopeptide repeat protein [Cystobacter ferrugineus]|uniref:Uncharacterized protein n=1 Tax=Cystobacter ferrugineus TaxID=83449 RepID=A0A1L9B788_9BACT|nr:tetratricopeptide repeat protein [Cystobacter ferrugineus]OJH38124.1 hypothetical protein BON30_23495 [Cystobacter ferrugineus]